MTLAKFAKTCAKNVGGNANLYLIDAANLTSVTITAGEVSAVVVASGTKFVEVEGDIDTIQREEIGEGNESGTNTYYKHRVTAKFTKPSATLNTLREALADASPCGIVAIVQDNNGDCWLVGYSAAEGVKRGLRLMGDSYDSGLKPNDAEAGAVTIVLERDSGALDIPFDATNNGTITGGTATFIDYN